MIQHQLQVRIALELTLVTDLHMLTELSFLLRGERGLRPALIVK